MKIRRTAAAVSALTVSALVLAACATSEPEGDGEGSGGEETGTEEAGSIEHVQTDYDSTGKVDAGITESADDDIYYSVGNQEWTGYNGDHAETYAVWTSVINARTQSAFTYYGTDGEIYQNEEYGSFEALSEDPLVVEYNVVEEAAFSDGNPIDYADALLDWAIQNPAFADDEGVPLFNSVSHTLGEYVPTPPEGEMGGKTFTYTYSEPYPDWQLMIGAFYPAHVVAEQIGLSEEELAQAILDEDMDVIADAAEFWNTGWENPEPGVFPDEELIPVTGPYKFSTWEAGQYVTLEANENYWGTPPGTARLTFRFVEPDGQVQALANGDLNVIEPQATVDTLEQLRALDDRFAYQTGDTLTWEHLDFNFNTGVFSDDEGGLELREAFAMCVPRQGIVDNLIKPLNEEAVVMNAREVFPFQENYEAIVSQSYDGQYDETDLAAAEELVNASGIETPIDVRITYAEGNQRRADQVAMIKSECDQVGFNVIDSASADFSDRFFTGAGEPWEVALFAWAGSGQIASGRNIYSTDAPQNGGGFSNETVDEAFNTLAGTVDPEVHDEQRAILERALWENLHGIPLFAHPGIVGYDASIQNVRATATQTQVVWNAEQWVR
ncbi:MAG TPA: ABC transporter substrate-binding protein [Ruania sp.]|nr:ABC transporter substrate-binding protein [Ruania sp.]